MKGVLIVGMGFMLAGAAMLVPVGGGMVTDPSAARVAPKNVPLSDISSEPPRSPLDLLLIHHSVGGRLLAAAGPRDAIASSIWRSHPEGGDLRRMLEKQGYVVHEASYGSEIGEATDRVDWLAKFRDKMDKVLSCDQNDRRLPNGQRNHIVVFKSCFPESLIEDEAALDRARATLSALLPIFARHPKVLFVFLTSPPLAPSVHADPLWKRLAKAVLGKPQPLARLKKSGPFARQFANWVTGPDGWLKDYPNKNVVAFDLFDVLTDHGKSNFLAYPTSDGFDSHPSKQGNQQVAAEFVPFLNRAVRRAGMADL
jgi:hypothetical protein